VLIENHGGSKRQVDVGVALRQTALAKLVKLGALAAAGLAAAGGLLTIAAEFGLAILGTEVFLSYQAYRLGRTLYHAAEITFQSLPLEPLQPEQTVAAPQP